MDFLPDGVAFNKNITYLAKTNFRAQEQVFGIKRRDRRQHMYVLGKSGSGKSALLGNMIVQNVWNGEGVCVIDPHGELVESVLATIPAHRAKDVIYFNPADTDYHIGFNVLQVDDPKYKHLVASGLMGIFTKIWANAWSARMEYILNNAILALADTPGSTLLGIPRLLVDKDYRQVVINNLKDPVIKAFWIHEYENWRDQYRNEAIAPIQNKVGQFLSTSIVRNVVGQSKSTIDLFEMMNSGKIFLVNVSKGRIGEDNSALLGGMIITKLQLAAMERVRIAEDDRKDFYLYVDEFQNFVTDSFASILSEARKYRLNLTLAHQYIAQLVTKDSEAVRDAVFGNVGTMIIFRVGAADAEFLEKEFEPEFMIQDMVNLPNYHSYLKLMVDGVTSRPFSAKTLPPFKIPVNSTVAAEIIESSRNLYARPREVVEKEINDWSGMLVGLEQEGKFKAVCSSCGKETSVPFEPEAGRPVYCKECIAKIKSGEMQPLKGTRQRSLEPQSFAALASLGIEFAEEAAPSAPRAGSPSLPRTNPVRPTPPAAGMSSTPVPQKITSTKPASIDATRPAPAQVARGAAPLKITPKPMENRPARPTAAIRPLAPNPAPVSTPKLQSGASEASKTFRPSRERKGPDHDGLQDILKQALGDVLNKNDLSAKMPTVRKEPVHSVPQPSPVEEKKTISLASLKKADSVSPFASKMTPKSASDERMSALQSAISRATTQQAAPTPTPIFSATSTPNDTKPIVPIDEKKAVSSDAEWDEASLVYSLPATTTAFVPKPVPVSEPIPEPVKETEIPVNPPKVPSPEPEPKKEEPSASSAEEKKADKEPATTDAPKRVREIPEDILRRVLNE